MIQFRDSDPWIFSGIYSSVSILNRNLLWDSLSSADLSNFPWLVLGDFNCISNAQDKLGGSPFSFCSSVRRFNCFLAVSALSDLGFISPRYTWCNNRTGPAHILIRLDRAFC